MTVKSSVVEIARLYYEHGKNQDDIAREYGISRSTVSRLLKEARDEGIVRFQIIDPNSVCTQIAARLEAKFNLKKAVVIEDDSDSADVIKRDIGVAGASLFSRMIRDNQTVGIFWGSTIYELVRNLVPKDVEGVRVVQMVGTLGNMLSDTHADQLARLIATNYDGEWHILPSPAVVESCDSAKTFLKEPHIRQVLEMAKESDIAIVGVGLCDDDALLARAGYLTSAEIFQLRSLGAIGEVGCRFFSCDGQPCLSEIDKRTISIELEDLRKIPTKIGLAGGLDKVDAICGALAGDYVNVLVTDMKTATALLERCVS